MQLDSHLQTIPDYLYEFVDELPTILHISYFDDDKTDLTVEELDLNKPSSLFGLQDWVADLSGIEIGTSSNREKSKIFGDRTRDKSGNKDPSDRMAEREKQIDPDSRANRKKKGDLADRDSSDRTQKNQRERDQSEKSKKKGNVQDRSKSDFNGRDKSEQKEVRG